MLIKKLKKNLISVEVYLKNSFLFVVELLKILWFCKKNADKKI